MMLMQLARFPLSRELRSLSFSLEYRFSISTQPELDAGPVEPEPEWVRKVDSRSNIEKKLGQIRRQG